MFSICLVLVIIIHVQYVFLHFSFLCIVFFLILNLIFIVYRHFLVFFLNC